MNYGSGRLKRPDPIKRLFSSTLLYKPSLFSQQNNQLTASSSPG